jgi:hypothetical protein
MIELDQKGEPLETPACCMVWKDIRHEFKWSAFIKHPNILAMPSVGNGWRVNFCPSCGSDVRNSIWRPD